MSNFYGATSLIGGGSGALDKIDGTALANLDGAVVITNSSIHAFHLDAASGAAENSPLVISPNANAGTKRWLLKSGVFAGLTTRLAVTGTHLTFNRNSVDVATFGVSSNTLTIDTIAGGSIILNNSQLDVDTKIFWGSGLAFRIEGSSGNINIGPGVAKTKLTVEGAITIQEQASADGDTAAYGQDWVKNTSPCERWFTDDAGSDMLIAPLAYGEISVVGNAIETAIASQNVYVQVTVFDTNGENFKVTPDHTNDHNTIVKAGRYFISCSITLNSVGGAGSTAEMEVKKNNGASRVGSLHVDRSLSGGGTESGAITITGFANLSVDDTIEVWIKNETNTQNYVVEDITLSLKQIGG